MVLRISARRSLLRFLCVLSTVNALVGPSATIRRRITRYSRSIVGLQLQQWPNNSKNVNTNNNSGNWYPPSPISINSNQQITDAIEERVKFSAQSQVDVDRILKLFDDTSDYATAANSDLLYDQEDLTVFSNLQIAVAASVTTALLSFFLWHSAKLTSIVCVAVFVAANTETVSGALARILGRTTLQVSQSYTPKLKALARAVVTGEEEIQMLRLQIRQLQAENDELKLYKQQRERVDQYLNRFSVSELGDLARSNGLPVSGTKNELLLRLIQYGVLE